MFTADRTDLCIMLIIIYRITYCVNYIIHYESYMAKASTALPYSTAMTSQKKDLFEGIGTFLSFGA